MMSEFKEYSLIFQKVHAGNERIKLRVLMHTSEFGAIESKTIDAVENEQVNNRLFETLADDIIDEYETRLSRRPAVAVVKK